MRLNIKQTIIALVLTVFANTVIAKQTQHSVLMEDSYFTPKSITINTGDTVSWVNKGEKVHTVTSSDRSISSGKIYPGGHFSYRFTKSGTYDYYCHQHTILYMGMKGEVIVK